MGAGEISLLMELNKRVAELEFKRDYLLQKGKDKGDWTVASMENEISRFSKQADELESKITTKGTIFYPNEKKIAELNEAMAKYGIAEISRAMEQKEGDVYALLEKRGKFLKENYGNRKEIAALVEFVNTLPSKIREEIIERTKDGKIGVLDASTLNERDRAKLFKLFNRSGIRCFAEGHKLVSESKKGTGWSEAKVELEGNYVWSEATDEPKTKEFMKQLVETGKAIQVMNAERHVRQFSAEEEKGFLDTQRNYLELLKKRNGMLAD